MSGRLKDGQAQLARLAELRKETAVLGELECDLEEATEELGVQNALLDGLRHERRCLEKESAEKLGVLKHVLRDIGVVNGLIERLKRDPADSDEEEYSGEGMVVEEAAGANCRRDGARAPAPVPADASAAPPERAARSRAAENSSSSSHKGKDPLHPQRAEGTGEQGPGLATDERARETNANPSANPMSVEEELAAYDRCLEQANSALLDCALPALESAREVELLRMEEREREKDEAAAVVAEEATAATGGGGRKAAKRRRRSSK